MPHRPRLDRPRDGCQARLRSRPGYTVEFDLPAGEEPLDEDQLRTMASWMERCHLDTLRPALAVVAAGWRRRCAARRLAESPAAAGGCLVLEDARTEAAVPVGVFLAGDHLPLRARCRLRRLHADGRRNPEDDRRHAGSGGRFRGGRSSGADRSLHAPRRARSRPVRQPRRGGRPAAGRGPRPERRPSASRFTTATGCGPATG